MGYFNLTVKSDYKGGRPPVMLRFFASSTDIRVLIHITKKQAVINLKQVVLQVPNVDSIFVCDHLEKLLSWKLKKQQVKVLEN